MINFHCLAVIFICYPVYFLFLLPSLLLSASILAVLSYFFCHCVSQPFTRPSLLVFLCLWPPLNPEVGKNNGKNGALSRQAGRSSLKCAQFAKNWP